MDLHKALNARLVREHEAELIKRDGGRKELLSGEFWKRGNYREPRRWQLRSLRRRVSRGYCHCHSLSGCWLCSRWHLAQLLGENWNWSTLLPRNGSQRGNWAPERDLGSNWLCLRLQAHLHTHKSRVSITMVKLRQRQPCRRGPARGSSSRAPAVDEHHHCCCCYCHRRARATPLPISQFLEVGSANEDKSELPSFGSVVFTLPSAESNPGLSAHISVMFTRTLEGNGETAPQNLQKKQAEGKGKEIDQGEQEAGEQSSALEPPASEAGPHETFPPVGPAPSDIDEETWRRCGRVDQREMAGRMLWRTKASLKKLMPTSRPFLLPQLISRIKADTGNSLLHFCFAGWQLMLASSPYVILSGSWSGLTFNWSTSSASVLLNFVWLLSQSLLAVRPCVGSNVLSPLPGAPMGAR